MENIFENAKHLDAFLTKNGHKAILVDITNNNDYEILVEGCSSTFSYKANGKRYVRQFGDEYDIVSRYQEPINEQKLDELAHNHCMNNGYSGLDENDYVNDETLVWGDIMRDIRYAYKAGYRKTIEE